MAKLEAILFDLGGVLIELDGPPIKPSWVDGSLTYEQSWQRWIASRYVRAFESGEISPDEFVAGVVKELRLNISEAEFRQAFIEWPKSLFEGAEDILKELKSRYTLAFFSNTSALHLPRLLNDLNLASYFHHTYASYDIGFFKPDVAGFDYVVADMGLPTESILFVDDNQINVEGARKAGLKAEKTFGIPELRSVLEKYNCL